MPREYGNAPHYAVYLPFALRLSVQCPGKRWENVLDMTGCTLSPPQQVKEGNERTIILIKYKELVTADSL